MANINSNDYFKGKRLQTIYQIYKERTSEKKVFKAGKTNLMETLPKLELL